MKRTYHMTVEELRDMLGRVTANPEEEQWRKNAAQCWIDRLDEIDQMWAEGSAKIDKLESKGYIGEALIRRMQVGQIFDNLALIIRDSAVVMFSEYLRKERQENG